MNVIVCMKQVPDTETVIKIAPDGKSIVTDDVKWVVNPYDELAVEEALKIKEKTKGKVTIVSVGPQRCVEAIRTCLAMGADEGVLIDDPATEGSDALGIAKILAAAMKDIPYDLVMVGQRAVDDDMGIIGAALASCLDIPQVLLVSKVEIEDGKATCTRAIEGAALIIETALPAVLTAQRGLNEPRYASLPGIMKAKRKPLATKTIADIGIDASAVGANGAKAKILMLNNPPERTTGQIVDGETPEEKAEKLFDLLRKEAKVI